MLELERTVPPAIEPFLMGWTESEDPFAPIKLQFADLHNAIAFAERHGWRYEVHDSLGPTRVRGSIRNAVRYDLSHVIARVQQFSNDTAARSAV
jgi:hypothetical protein